MRNQWRLLLRNRHHQIRRFSSSSNITRPLSLLQVTSKSTSPLYLSSFNPLINSHFHNPNFLRHFSSIDEKSNDPSVIISIFAKPINGDKIKNELDANNVVITRDLVLNVIKNLNSDPKNAIKFFDWVLERANESVSSKAYNFMLGVLGSNALVNEFWEMVDCMRKKGYGVRKGAFDKVLERFEKDGLQDDVERLKGLFSKDPNSSVEFACARISNIIRRKAWDEDVEKELNELGVNYSTELVGMVLDKLSDVPMKCLIFFRWVPMLSVGSSLFKHDQRTYNEMAVVLGREECVDRFWNVIGDMRNAGCVLERETYAKVLEKFIKKRMMKDSVGLFELAMDGADKPTRQECTFLLKKISVAKDELNMELFSRVVKAFTRKGFALDDSMFDAVLKSLTSVGRMRMYNKVLDAMVKGGFKPSMVMQSRVAYDLSSSRMKNEANKLMVKLEDYGLTPDSKTWVSLIEGHCVGGDLKKARECFEKMVERGGASSAGYVLDLLVNAYCNRNKATEACKIFTDLVNKDIIPLHTTYKTLISNLTVHKEFKEALSLLGLMKNHGFPPFLDPFIAYLVRRGNPEEALLFFKSMTVKKFPSTNVFLRVFEAYFKAGKHSQAQNLLAKCPQYIRNNADVLDLFCSMKPEKPAEPAAVAV